MALHVELVAADQAVWTGEAKMVVAKTVEGEIGLLPGHEPMLAILASGEVRITLEGGEIINNIARGSTYVLAIAGVLGAGWWATRQQVQNDSETQST
jgi:F0F1-type ATP synthase epsilon subunit